MMQTALDIANLVAALAVLYLVTCACHAMSKRTRRAIVAAFVLLGVGAFGSGLAPWLAHRHAGEAELVGNLGLALLLFATRRKTVLTHARGIAGAQQ